VIYQSDRVFKLWDYTDGHAQLLFRSPPTDDEPFNIDLVFLGVERLDIPTKLDGVSMSEPENLDRYHDLHRLTSGGKEYSIVAVAFRIFKNQHELMESSLEYFGREESKDPGEALSHTGLFRRRREVAGRISPD
jgi:hypothetical protein